MDEARVCVVGSLNMDMTMVVERLPVAGETVIGRSFTRGPGGKGANQAVASARAGASTAMVGRVGNDDHGRELRAILERERIDTVGVQAQWDVPTGLADVVVDARGENQIVVVSGANATLEPGDVQESAARIARASVLLVQLEVPVQAVLEAARIARAHGTRVVLNAAPATNLPTELLGLIDVLVCNQLEAETIGGAVGEDQAEAALAQLGVAACVITRGGRGSTLLMRGERTHHASFDVTPIDTVGAGDAFVGSLGAAWSATGGPDSAPSHDALPEVLRYASATGSLATTRRGALDAIPRRPEVEALLAQHGG
ncbi:MAG: ribokinase [Planctomycetota bacterium]|mgnify:CR=1 FL=1